MRRNFTLPLSISRRFSNPLINALLILVVALVVVVAISFLSAGWGQFGWGQYGESGFMLGILFEAHGMVLDIFVIGILLLWLNRLGQSNLDARRYLEEIDDYRGWQEPEASFRIAGAVRRLSRLGDRDIDLTRCYLIGANLEGVNLRGVDLQYATLTGCNLRDADLRGANLENADIQGEADLYHVNLRGARLDSAKLGNAKMRRADLRKADLFHADLHEAFLRDADFQDANLQGANLMRTNLRDAKNLTVEQLCSTRTLREVILDLKLEVEVRKVCPTLFEGSSVPAS